MRDQDNQIIKVITSDRDLAAFRDMWSTMSEAEPASWTPAAGRSHYKLDIQWTRRAGRTRTSRWLYHPDGFVNLVAKWRAIWVAPLYRAPTPAEFETILRPAAAMASASQEVTPALLAYAGELLMRYNSAGELKQAPDRERIRGAIRRWAVAIGVPDVAIAFVVNAEDVRNAVRAAGDAKAAPSL